MITSIINDFLQKDSNILHVAVNNSKVNTISDEIKLDTLITDLFDTNIFYSPIAPFLSILKQTKLSEDDIIQNTYLPQRPLFLSYLQNGTVPERRDVLILKEIHYEKKRCFQTITNLLEKIPNKYLLILNAQNLGNEAIEFIDYYNQTKHTKKIIFIYSLEGLAIATSRNQFFANIEESDDYYVIESEVTNSAKEVSSEEQFIVKLPNKVNSEFFIHTFQNARAFFSFNEGNTLEKFFTNSSTLLQFTPVEQSILYYERAAFQLVLGSLDEALFFLNSSLEQEYSEDLYYKIMLVFSYIYFAKGLYDNALYYANSIIHKTTEDSIYYAIAYMLVLICNDRNRKLTTEAEYEKVQDLLHRFELENNRIYSALYFPKDTLENVKHNTSNMAIIENVISDCKHISNEFALSGAYQWKSIFLEKINKAEALTWQRKCYDIRINIGDFLSIVKSSNGLSYEYFLLGDYLSAFNMLNSLVSKAFSLSDNAEIVTTFYNIAKILFFSKNFTICYTIIQKVLRLMNIYHIKDFFFCKENDSILLKGIIDFYKGEFTKSVIALNNVEHNGKEKSLYCEALTYFLKALFLVKNNEIEKAVLIINNIPQYAYSLDHEVAFIYYEFASYLYKQGYQKQAEVFDTKAKEITKAKELKYYVENYLQKEISEYADFSQEFPPLSIDLESVERIAENKNLINKAQKKIQEARFIDNITSLGFKFQDLSQYIQSFCKYFIDYTLSSGIFVAQKQGNQWFCVGSYARDNCQQPTPDNWDEYFSEAKDHPIYHFIEVATNRYYVDISIYDFNAGLVIEFSDSGLTQKDNIEVIKNAISHLQSAMTIFSQNENLQRLSTTDQLTQLNNRRAIEIKMTESEGVLQRFSNAQTLFVAITIIDLDNFKFYNDTFGHKAGDYMLIFFSELLRKVYRKIDFICRFGGDEFVILSTDAKIPNPVCAVERIRKALYEEEWFVPKLESALKTTLQIPQNKLLGFSAGICTNLQVIPGWNIETVLHNADLALCKVKQTGKNKTLVWNEEDCPVF